MREISDRLVLTVERAAAALREIGEEDAAKPRLAGGWSAKQVIGHLLDSASNNHQRFVRTAIAGSLEFPNYDQNAWSQVEAFQEAPWAMLVEAWTAANRVLAHVLARLPKDAEGYPCQIGEHPPMPLGEVAESYLSHMAHHLEQLGAA
jgi:uncharacterized damage-inducible protein DinB